MLNLVDQVFFIDSREEPLRAISKLVYSQNKFEQCLNNKTRVFTWWVAVAEEALYAVKIQHDTNVNET